jgi:hypothetical protein
VVQTGLIQRLEAADRVLSFAFKCLGEFYPAGGVEGVLRGLGGPVGREPGAFGRRARVQVLAAWAG